MLEILKSMWMSKGTTVEQGSKVYRYIDVFPLKSFCVVLPQKAVGLCLLSSFDVASLVRSAISIKFVHVTQRVILAKDTC